MKKAILPLIIAIMFLAVPTASAIETVPTEAGKTGVMNVMTRKNSGDLRIHEVSITQEDVISFTNEIISFKEWIWETRPFIDFKLTQEEKSQIKAKLNNILSPLNVILEENDLDPITTDWLFREMFETEFGRSTIISVGVGYAFIPFYEYEMLFGSMIRPIWLIYLPLILGSGGYTGNLNLNLFPFRIEFGDKLGAHMVRTTFFTGLYLNVGEVGFDTLLGGVMIMLGRARVVM